MSSKNRNVQTGMSDSKGDESARSHLLDVREKAYASIDKTILTLSAGSIAVSIAFIKDVLGAGQKIAIPLLLFAWGSWALSVVLTLLSFFFSIWAIDHELDKIEKRPDNRWHKVKGCCSSFTRGLNVASALFFVIGLVLFFVFVGKNLYINADTKEGRKNAEQQTSEPADKHSETANSQGPTSQKTSY